MKMNDLVEQISSAVIGMHNHNYNRERLESIIRAEIEHYNKNIDVQSLKLSEENYVPYENRYLLVRGWNDCINYLKENGFLSHHKQTITIKND